MTTGSPPTATCIPVPDPCSATGFGLTAGRKSRAAGNVRPNETVRGTAGTAIGWRVSRFHTDSARQITSVNPPPARANAMLRRFASPPVIA